MNYLIHYALEATRGGEMRKRILEVLLAKPMNANQITKELSIDYKTTQHHMKVLYSNKLVASVNKGKYGEMYFVEDETRKYLEKNRDEIGKTNKKKK